MKQRIASLFLAVALLLSLAACAQSAPAETPPARQSVNEMVAGYLAKADESYAYKIAETLAYDPAYLSNDLGWRTAEIGRAHV